MILTATVFIGILQTVLDVYWQQTFVAYMPSDFLYLIGVISCMGFAVFWFVIMDFLLSGLLFQQLRSLLYL